MDTLKQIIQARFKTFAIISTLMLFSLVLLMVRMKIMHSFYFLFFVWNLFLAAIPFAITTYLINSPKLNKYGLIIWFGVWLLFLPNAPYIITDLMHLKRSNGYFMWLDILVVISFALCGLILYYLSVTDMKKILAQRIHKKILDFTFIAIPFLSAFGIYLGRFLRYNSWEVFSNPFKISVDIYNLISNPLANKEIWLFRFLFGIFLFIGQWLQINMGLKDSIEMGTDKISME